eukprot:689036-Rhodomonas_salina.1
MSAPDYTTECLPRSLARWLAGSPALALGRHLEEALDVFLFEDVPRRVVRPVLEPVQLLPQLRQRHPLLLPPSRSHYHTTTNSTTNRRCPCTSVQKPRVADSGHEGQQSRDLQRLLAGHVRAVREAVSLLRELEVVPARFDPAFDRRCP